MEQGLRSGSLCRRRDSYRRRRPWLGKLIGTTFTKPHRWQGGGVFLFPRPERSGWNNHKKPTMNTNEQNQKSQTPQNTLLAQLYYQYVNAGLNDETAQEAALADYACIIEYQPHVCPAVA